mgnify:CR=1 FL=1
MQGRLLVREILETVDSDRPWDTFMASYVAYGHGDLHDERATYVDILSNIGTALAEAGIPFSDALEAADRIVAGVSEDRPVEDLAREVSILKAAAAIAVIRKHMAARNHDVEAGVRQAVRHVSAEIPSTAAEPTMYRLTLEGVASDPEDADVAGVYLFSLPRDYPEEHRASAILDAFHRSVPISVLDDFSMVVTDGDGVVLFEPEGAEAYVRKDDALFHGKAENPVPAAPSAS